MDFSCWKGYTKLMEMNGFFYWKDYKADGKEWIYFIVWKGYKKLMERMYLFCLLKMLYKVDGKEWIFVIGKVVQS